MIINVRYYYTRYSVFQVLKKKKKAKPTHVSAGLNRLYVSVFDYGVTAIIASN